MALVYSKYLTKTNVSAAAAALAAAFWLVQKSSRNSHSKLAKRKFVPAGCEEVEYLIADKKKPRIKAHVDALFFKRVLKLLKIVIPGWVSKETGFLLLIAGSLVARSMCDLYLINYFTLIESAIVGMDKNLFKKRIINFFMIMPLISIVNNVLKYAVGELKIIMCNTMTRHLYDEYLQKYTYYRVSNLDKRIANIDQLLTTDVSKLCDSFTDLYCNITKPILEVFIYVYKLNANLGYGTSSLMLGYMGIMSFVLTRLRRPVGTLTVNEQKLEGEFRHINSRLITHSEEIAFYSGNNREKATVNTSFNKLIKHLRKFLHFRSLMGILDDILTKYFAFVVGYAAMSLPFIYRQNSKLSQLGQKKRSMLYYTFGGMMVRLGLAVGRLALAGRELNRLAGYTVRITELKEVLADLNEGKFERATVKSVGNGTSSLLLSTGKLIFRDKIIKFDEVPIVTPNGDVLIDKISFEIKSGMNVIVCGPNGAGKSSLFRILGELWPLCGGQLTKPPRGKLFYIPQRPYMTLGNLRDQITYPHSGAEAGRRGCTDEKLETHLKRVQLEYLLEREGRFDAVADWLEVLSGGEKQRIAMARLFYHAPQFAILDECTSAVSLDVEESMYEYCKEAEITLLTVSHRKSLWKHHEYMLHLDGRGSYRFELIREDTEEFGS